MSRALSLLTIPTVPQDVVSALNSNEGGMSAFESLLSVYEMVRGQHNHGACSHLITRFLCRFQEKSTMKSEYEKQKDALISERDTALFDVNVAQARCQSISTQVDAARARTGAAEAHIQAMSEEQGGMLAKAHAMEREKVELEKALAIAKSDIKYVRVSQRKGYQSRDKERELVNKEMRWLMSLAMDITDEGKSRPVLANSLWAVVARFQSLQTRAKAELLASEARGATSAVDLR